MVLTPLAEELARPVHELLQQAEVVIRRTAVFSPESSERRFRIVMSDYVAIVLMTRALPQIQRQAPGVILPLRTGALEQGDPDLVVLPAQILAKDYPSEMLFHDEFFCIACAKNKLIKKTLSVREYPRLEYLLSKQSISRFEVGFI